MDINFTQKTRLLVRFTRILGASRLFITKPLTDRRPALQSILRTLLKSYLDFVRSLLIAPPPIIELEQLPEWQSHAEWLTVMSQNIMSAANELRPVQVRYMPSGHISILKLTDNSRQE